jgi:hypothetical protein
MNQQPIPLARSILGMFAGYVCSVVLVLFMVGLCYIQLGADGAFAPDTYRDSPLFEVLKSTSGFVAAIAAGWLACRIGGTRATVMLAVLITVTGLVNGSLAWNKQESRNEPWVARAPGVVNFTVASENIQNSALYVFATPFLGCAGSLVGGAMCIIMRRVR